MLIDFFKIQLTWHLATFDCIMCHNLRSSKMKHLIIMDDEDQHFQKK
jgi:hypothetical protein